MATTCKEYEPLMKRVRRAFDALRASGCAVRLGGGEPARGPRTRHTAAVWAPSWSVACARRRGDLHVEFASHDARPTSAAHARVGRMLLDALAAEGLTTVREKERRIVAVYLSPASLARVQTEIQAFQQEARRRAEQLVAPELLEKHAAALASMDDIAVIIPDGTPQKRADALWARADREGKAVVETTTEHSISVGLRKRMQMLVSTSNHMDNRAIVMRLAAALKAFGIVDVKRSIAAVSYPVKQGTKRAAKKPRSS